MCSLLKKSILSGKKKNRRGKTRENHTREEVAQDQGQVIESCKSVLTTSTAYIFSSL